MSEVPRSTAAAGRGTGWKSVLLVLLVLLLLHLSGIDLREGTLAREDGSVDAVEVDSGGPPE